MSTVRVGAPPTPLTQGSTRTLDRSHIPAGVRRRLRRLAGVRAGRLLVALLLPLSAFTWLSGQKTVSLAVDGRTTQVQTHADTVGELLDRNGIEANAVRVAGSPMSPAPQTVLSDGMVVELSAVTAADRRAPQDSDDEADPEGGASGSDAGEKTPSDRERGGLTALLPGRSTDDEEDAASESASEDESEDTSEDAAEFEDAQEAEDAEEADDLESGSEQTAPGKLSTPANLQRGKASWYDYGNGYTAAHRTLPKGTLVKVTNVANGQSVQVRINDRGPFIKGRVIDLNRVAFKDIASVNEGVIDVLVTW